LDRGIHKPESKKYVLEQMEQLGEVGAQGVVLACTEFPFGSMYSFFGSGLVPSYSAAKGAIVQLTKSMAIELAPHNIQVNAIALGWIETDMTAPVRTMSMNDEILARTPAGRWGQPEEVAGTAVYLASRASDFVTGTTIRVDGGYAIR
jgi:2-deoxy-D-gluconate 3-dehydrogenase